MNEKILAPNDSRLSLSARGILTTMLNVPECDYCSLGTLAMNFETNSLQEIKTALKELCNLGYVICIANSLFAVNKMMIPAMQQL